MMRRRTSLGRKRIRTQVAAAILVCLCTMLVSAGCGGGGGSSSSNPGNGGNPGNGLTPTQQTQLTQDQTQLNTLVSADATPSASSVATVASSFKTLYQSAPTNPTVAADYAISEAALDGLNLNSTLDLSSISLNSLPLILARTAVAHSEVKAIAATSSREAVIANMLIIWRLPQALVASSGATLPTGLDLVPGLSALQSGTARPAVTNMQIQTDLTTLDADLANVQLALAVPLADPSFSITIPDYADPANKAGLKIGNAELKVLATVISVARAIANVGLVYNLDNSAYPTGSEPAATVFAPQLAAPNSIIASSAYLPSSPFLTLESDGDTRADNVLVQLEFAVTESTSAISEVNTRNNAGYLLDPGTAITASQLDTISADITADSAYLTKTEPFTNFDGTSINATIDANKWLTDPPASLAALMPSLTSSTASDSNPDLYVSATDFPDSTFGGLFPGGIPFRSISAIGPSNNIEVPAGSTTPTVSDVADYVLSVFGPDESGGGGSAGSPSP
jgi:hypothetical protein